MKFNQNDSRYDKYRLTPDEAREKFRSNDEKSLAKSSRRHKLKVIDRKWSAASKALKNKQK